MLDKIIKSLKPKLDAVIQHFQGELATLRTGRANPALVENLLVDCYETKTLLKQVASIHTQDARTIVIQPWDRSNLKGVERAIQRSDLGLSCQNDGVVIRAILPPLTEERRQELVKVLRTKIEESKISVRNLREEAWTQIQTAEKNKEISEDEMYRGKDELQKLIDEYNKKIENLGGKKEAEIMQV